ESGRSQSYWSWYWFAALILVFIAGKIEASEYTADQQGGELVFEDGGHAVHLGTEFRLRIQGLQAEVEVTQSFVNNADTWVNATYTYPMADDSAVTRLSMIIGE